MINPKKILIMAFFLLPAFHFAQDINCDYIITPDVEYLNGVDHMPGDTFCLQAGYRGSLYLGNLSGTPDSALVFINLDGKVTIESEKGYGISISNCQYIKILGQGSEEEYGIHISSVPSGSGIKAGMLSSDLEIANLEISNTKYTGITAKSDPTCDLSSIRGNFTMYNTHIHDNYIHDIGTEGMYIGNSFFTGVHLDDCDTTVQPHILDGVDIHHNIIERSGWDGIQLGCALLNSSIHDNTILYDSQDERVYQMSGIMVNPGSRCDVYNNTIMFGKGTGISLQGIGGQRIFNNLIVESGIGYEMDNQTTAQKFGIFCKYEYNEGLDSSFLISQNTIIHPKSDGIRFQNTNSTQNKFYNNIIVNPGAFDYYEENGNTSNEGMDSYIYLYFDGVEMDSSHNYFKRDIENLGFIDIENHNFRLAHQSPAIDRGKDLSFYDINFDLEYKPRPDHTAFDIGAFEAVGVGIEEKKKQYFKVFPNPFNNYIYIQNNSSEKIESLSIFDTEGSLVYFNDTTESNYYNLQNMESGIYLAKIKTNTNQQETIKLIKL